MLETKAQGRGATAGSTWAGAAVADITPAGSVFLFGYPHVPRMSTGVHDPLECAAFFVRADETAALFVANDLIYFSRDFATEVRRRVAAATRVPAEGIMLTATHTHSGPVMANNVGHASDPVVPKASQEYLHWLSDKIVATAVAAVDSAVSAELGLTLALAAGVGTNRHNPIGPTDPDVPVLVARALATREPIACLLVYGMHPTVLHEDSTLISADFPFFTRRALRAHSLPATCPVIYHQGAAGNQSPRHVTKANTFAEAQRIGENLARAIAAAIPRISFAPVDAIRCRRGFVTLEPRSFPPIEAARAAVSSAREKFDQLRRSHSPPQTVRTAECDVFGAERTAELARAAADGRLGAAIKNSSPAEIQVITIGPWSFVGWPGEFFVEYGLALKSRAPATFLITLANGELQGYIVTPDAVARGAYEATNAVFTAGNGPRFVEETLALLGVR